MEPADTIMHVTVNISHDNYRLQMVVGKGDSVSHCDWVRRCVVGTALSVAPLRATTPLMQKTE